MVCMSKPIKLTERQWASIYNQIAKSHPSSVLLIRDKMKKVLGFTVRRHHGPDSVTGMYESALCLDFFDESKRTMFLLKYSEILHDAKKV